MVELTLDQEFRALIQPLTAEELAQLEASLLAEGCRDPLVLWAGTDAPQVCVRCQAERKEVCLKRLMWEEDGGSSSSYATLVFECPECSSQYDHLWTLLDGHHRYPICQAHHLSFAVVEAPNWVKTRDDAKIWIIKNQLARRNLEPFQRAELALTLEPMIAEQAKRQQGMRTDLVQNSAEGFRPIETREELAMRAGVSHDTIRKVKAILKGADEPTKDALRRGTRSIHAVHKTLPRRCPASRTTAAAASSVPSPTPVQPAPVEPPPQLWMAQRLIDLADGMLEELAAWRRQAPHDAVVHAFGRMETHLTEIKDYFGKKHQAMCASFATGNTAEAVARPREDAGAERTTSQPDDTPEAPATGAAEAFSGERHDRAPAPATDVSTAEADTYEAPIPAITDTTTPGTEWSNTQAQETFETTPPQACESPSQGDPIRPGGLDARAQPSNAGAGAENGDTPSGSPGATSTRAPNIHSLRRQLCKRTKEWRAQHWESSKIVQQLNDEGVPTLDGHGEWDVEQLEAFERYMGLRV